MSVRSRRGENIANWAMSRDSEGEGIVGWGRRWRSFVDVGVRSCCLCFFRDEEVCVQWEESCRSISSESGPYIYHQRSPISTAVHLLHFAPLTQRYLVQDHQLAMSVSPSVSASAAYLKPSSPGELHPRSSLARAVPREKRLGVNRAQIGLAARQAEAVGLCWNLGRAGRAGNINDREVVKLPTVQSGSLEMIYNIFRISLAYLYFRVSR